MIGGLLLWLIIKISLRALKVYRILLGSKIYPQLKYKYLTEERPIFFLMFCSALQNEGPRI